MFRILLVVLGCLAIPSMTMAQTAPSETQAPDHSHKNRGSHGGLVRHIGNFEAELTVKGGSVALYLTHRDTAKPVPMDGIVATLFVVQGGQRKQTVVLKPSGNALQGVARISSRADAVINVRFPDGYSDQARYELGSH